MFWGSRVPRKMLTRKYTLVSKKSLENICTCLKISWKGFYIAESPDTSDVPCEPERFQNFFQTVRGFLRFRSKCVWVPEKFPSLWANECVAKVFTGSWKKFTCSWQNCWASKRFLWETCTLSFSSCCSSNWSVFNDQVRPELLGGFRWLMVWVKGEGPPCARC